MKRPKRYPERMADAVNGLPQIAAHRAALCPPGIYVNSNLSERQRMQNQRNATQLEVLRPSPLPLHRLASPKVVLMAVGLLGLVLDLFVRPISVTGLALIVLATTPWILQAWTLRAQPMVSNTFGRAAHTEVALQSSMRKATQEPKNDTSGQKIGVTRPERPSQPAADAIRKVQPAEPTARQLPLEASRSELQRRPAPPGGSELRTS
jgi:hypothetical protein